MANKSLMSRVSFKTVLFFAILGVVSILAIVVLFIEVQRPWQELDRLILQGKIIVSNVRSSFPDEELKQMKAVKTALDPGLMLNPGNILDI